MNGDVGADVALTEAELIALGFQTPGSSGLLAERIELVIAERVKEARAAAWDEGHRAGRDYQGDGWNSDAHDPADDNPYRSEVAP